jgi:manganese/zinc/iron transport system permease protein
VTVVGAFDIVGSILVVALMVAPPLSAYLLTDRLERMLALSALFGGLSALAGYWLAIWLDVSIAGAMATTAGLLFGLVFLLAPERGLAALARRRSRQRLEFAQAMLAIHLLHHEGSPEAGQENRVSHLKEHLRWEPAFAGRVIRLAEEQNWVVRRNGSLALTELGRQRAQQVLMQSS